MAKDYRHTDAAEMESFLAKPQSAQLLEIWLNGRETNGHVAELRRDLDAQGLEIQKARVDLSKHAELPHLTNEEGSILINQHKDMWSVWRFSRWFIPFSIPASIMLFAAIVELWRYWK